MTNRISSESVEQAALSVSESEMSELWLSEAERRDAELDSGSIAAVPGDEVFSSLLRRFGKQATSIS